MNSLYSNLSAYWNLNEPGGTRNSADGLTPLTDVNTVTQAAGVPLYAANFVRANSEYLYSADNPRLAMAAAQDFSMVVWVYMATNVGNMSVFDKRDSSGSSYAFDYYLFTSFPFGKYIFGVSNGTTYTELLAGTLITGVWTFIYTFHDAVNDLVGIEFNTTDYYQQPWAGGCHHGTGGFAVGRSGDISNNYWDGRICGLGIWKRTLTYQERLWLYNQGRGRLYPFDGRPFLDTILSHGGRQRRLRTA